MENQSMTAVRRVLYAAVFVVASFPVTLDYIMDRGDILLWLARIEELRSGLSAGSLALFPSAEVTVAHEGGAAALNSNLWLLIPAIIQLLGGSVSAAYRIYILLLNGLAIVSAKKMFGLLFENKNTAFFGVLLYMTCPYRIYIYYDKADLGMAAAWALIPLFIWGIMKISEGRPALKKVTDICRLQWKSLIIAAAAFAGIGYASGILWVMTAGFALLTVLYKRKAGILPAVLLGGILYLPGAVYLARYLIKGGMEVWNIPLGTISENGYRLGHFFMSWTYPADRPGLGLGLLGALLILLWLWLVEGNMRITKKYGFFAVAFFLFAFLSMSSFPWDMVQRVGAPFLRLTALMETPGICFGFATLSACVLGAYGAECAAKQEKLFVRVGIPAMIVVAAMGTAMYMCNALAYSGEPLLLL